MLRITYKPVYDKYRWNRVFVLFRTWTEIEGDIRRRYTAIFQHIWRKRSDKRWKYSPKEEENKPRVPRW